MAAPTRYFVALAHEQFPPDELLEQAVEAERAGFDGVACSDHFQPWWEPGHSGHAWVWLGAAAQATERVAVGPGVTPPVHRYHPALVAQMAATLEVMFPRRTFLGLGSGESLNESPLGMEWPDGPEQLERLEQAIEIIRRLWQGERLDTVGHFRMKRAYLHTRPWRQPPIYVSAFNDGAARVAGRLADGIWTLGDPRKVPGLLEAYHEGCAEVGKEPGEILLHVPFSWAETDEQAFESAQHWRATLPDEFYVDDVHEPAELQRRAQEQIADAEVKAGFVMSGDPDHHVKRIQAVEKLGATTIVLMNISVAAPVEALRVYGAQVLPKLRQPREPGLVERAVEKLTRRG